MDPYYYEPATLVDLLEVRGNAGRGIYTFIAADGKKSSDTITSAVLLGQAKALAREIVKNCARGSRVIVIYPPGLEFLKGFFACLFAGVVAVPVPAPDQANLKRALPRVESILSDAAPAAILTTAAMREALRFRLSQSPGAPVWIATDSALPDSASGPSLPVVQPGDLAYLQYTSGSTATPRGVMLTHRNVLQNLEYLRQGFGYSSDCISVTWMPHFHDFGLVEGLLQPLYSGISCYILAPVTLLKRPHLWLETISRFRATHSHAPNFAFELCVERVTAIQRSGLDLSSWRVAANGAEPVRAGTLQRFSAAFAECGFRPQTFYPGYGLAEACLFVTARRHEDPLTVRHLDSGALGERRVVAAEPGARAREVVSCGVPRGAMQIRIVDPESCRVCETDRVGEVWIADPCVATGYWNRPEATAETFEGRLKDSPSERPFLRTGDLGFLDRGNLYITGRLKDLIILGGLNHYPTILSQPYWPPPLHSEGTAVQYSEWTVKILKNS